MRLLNRFANATWKASQPFRDLNRITRPNFIIASSLSKEEVDKDSMQIFHAAEKLLASMSSARDSSVEIQMKLLHALLRDTVFAVEMAEHLHASYNSGSAQREPLFLPGDDTATVVKTAKQMKIATSVAGFYALECGLNYLVTIRNERASAFWVLQYLPIWNQALTKLNMFLRERSSNHIIGFQYLRPDKE